jgi:hypothetical protein
VIQTGLASQKKWILPWPSIWFHKILNAVAFFREIVSLLKPEGKLLIVEPKFHVSASAFRKTLVAAQQAGLNPICEPKIFFSRSMLFQLSCARQNRLNKQSKGAPRSKLRGIHSKISGHVLKEVIYV